MRLDHFAIRCADRDETSKFLMDAFEYKKQEEFDLEFDDGTTCKCIALTPPEKKRAPHLLIFFQIFQSHLIAQNTTWLLRFLFHPQTILIALWLSGWLRGAG